MPSTPGGSNLPRCDMVRHPTPRLWSFSGSLTDFTDFVLRNRIFCEFVGKTICILRGRGYRLFLQYGLWRCVCGKKNGQTRPSPVQNRLGFSNFRFRLGKTLTRRRRDRRGGGQGRMLVRFDRAGPVANRTTLPVPPPAGDCLYPPPRLSDFVTPRLLPTYAYGPQPTAYCPQPYASSPTP